MTTASIAKIILNIMSCYYSCSFIIKIPRPDDN